MKLYNIELPDIKEENVEQILKIALQIHQDYFNSMIKNTKSKQWEKYWIDFYEFMLNKNVK